MPSSTKSTLIWVILSFAAIYVIWGSTYLFIAYTVERIPPFLMSALRFSAGSMLLLGLAALLGKVKSVSNRELKNAALAGFLFLGCGTGGVAWALQYVDSGFTALVISGQPLLVLLLMWLINGDRPARQSFGGIFLGMLGMYLLVSQKELVARPEQWKGILAIFSSMIAWGIGSIFVTKVDLPKPQMVNNACQMMAGGATLLGFSFLLENPTTFSFTAVPTVSWLALGYLVVFGAVVAFSAFNYLLTKVTPEKVATSTYVNPVVALFLGWYFRDELVTTQSMVAVAVMFTGVFFINATTEQTRNFVRKVRSFGQKRLNKT